MMARFSFFLLALCAIHPAATQDLEEGQTPAQQIGTPPGAVSDNPARDARLRLRQTTQQCLDPGYLACSAGDGCCPPDFFCCPADCCTNGTRCCPGGGCVLPGGECCGGGWSCRAGEKCVPGEQSLCYSKTANCPSATTVTSTVTTSSRVAKTTTRTITQAPDDEDLPEFSCEPMTVTNDIGETLELGDDCAIEYSPATTTANSGTNREAAQPRQAPCPDQSTSTVTTTTTKASTYMSTVTTTKMVAETAPPDFSCAPMTVTNTFGDELAMDEECAMEFSPGSGSQTQHSSPPLSITTQPGGAQSNRGSSFMALPLAAFAVVLA